MEKIFIDISKYILVVLMAIYTYISYTGIAYRDENKRAVIYRLQNVFMFAIHFTGYMVLYLQDYSIDIAILYVSEFIFFFMVIVLYSVIYPRASRLLVNNMCMLMAIGFIMLARLNYDKCVKQFLIGVAGMIITFIVPWLLKNVKVFKNIAYIYLVAGLTLLAAVLLGSKIFGANLTLSIGPVSVQPAEFVKIIYVLFVASMFNKSTTFKRTAVTTFFAALHVGILVLANDLGAALIFFVVYLMMLFIATKRFLYVLLGLVCGSGAACAAYKMFSHVRVRVQVWLDPWSDIDNKGYQIAQSLFSIGMGSWFGTGLCNGMPDKIPVAEKDFMFSAIAEEFGVLFALCIILLTLNCLILMMNIASMCNTLFYRLVAVGLATTFGFQVFLTIGGAIKLIPLTGVTLPFVSYGGSSLLSSMILVGIINGMYLMRQNDAKATGMEAEYVDRKK